VNVLSTGARLARYRIDAVLAHREGFVVYAATEDDHDRAVAITVLDEPSDAPEVLRDRAQRAEHVAGLARLRPAEPIATGRLPDGTAFVVTERAAALPIITRSPAPAGAFGLAPHAGGGAMDAGHAMLALTSQRAQRRASGRLKQLGRNALMAVALALALAIAWLLLR
jgi:hypothetical protein